MVYDFMIAIRTAHRKVQDTNRILELYRPQLSNDQVTSDLCVRSLPSDLNMQILEALESISQPLAHGYTQIYFDLSDSTRVSWAGTVHLLREIMSGMLRILAPDDDVIKQPWFKSVTANGKPSQGQRARYILETRDAGSTEIELVEKHIDFVDVKASKLIRSTYNRASVAAHGNKGKREVTRILGYFEAFTHDLLDLQ